MAIDKNLGKTWGQTKNLGTDGTFPVFRPDLQETGGMSRLSPGFPQTQIW
ncbi:MAG TPA: hypothetical protein VN517_02165 [Terriglobales bacterium]|nr:hypothetical protein [Terriglobales bacterium]